MARVFRGILLVAGILALTAGSAHAQAIGSIFGKVTDPSGGVLPGVTVTVTGTGLQQPLVGRRQASGAYQFPSVPIGTYSVTFELSRLQEGRSAGRASSHRVPGADRREAGARHHRPRS